jgi:AraC family transcriptional regulator of adaptative response / DNA-3-methyladenine glycosylase II
VHKELGVSPVELAQTHRLLLAKRLLSETQLPAAQVAFASGFGSVRRFNALFRSRYRLSPTQVRRSRQPTQASPTLRLNLAYRPPLAWDAMLSLLAARATPGVEFVAGRKYCRTAAVGKHRGWLCAAPVEGRSMISVEISNSLVPVLGAVLAKLKSLFDLDARPDVIDGRLAGDPRLAPLVLRRPGMRVPGAFCGFELAIRAVLGQQVSVRGATTMYARLAAALGEPIETPLVELAHLPPSAEQVAAASLERLRRLGITSARAECLRALARAVAEGELTLEATPAPEAVIERLIGLPGIGERTAQYIALRALRWPDAFPCGDLGIRKALGISTARQVLAASEAWRPWRGYAAMHLWNSLSNA